MSAAATSTGTDGRWRARRIVAWTVAMLVRIGPVIVGLVASLVVAMLLPAPTGAAAVVLWWTAVAVTPLVVVVAVERALRGLAPLTFLLRLSLTFPGQAPGRLKVLRETHRTGGLIDQLRDGDPDEVEALPTAASVLALITALQRHDRFSRGHSERVRLYADLLGEELNLAESQQQRLRWAALLHDIGKLRVDGEVLNKDGRPDDDEWQQLRRHPELGLRLAGPLVPWLEEWAGAISEHHERFDGTGYPVGKVGHGIALGGRIVAVADAYETMTAGRPYKQALSQQDARDELVACAGSQFDPQVVRSFLNLSLPRTPWPVALLAWLAEVPLLTKLKAAPSSAVHGAATAAGIAAMAVSGLVSPSPSPPGHGQQPAPVVAQPDHETSPKPLEASSRQPRDPAEAPLQRSDQTDPNHRDGPAGRSTNSDPTVAPPDQPRDDPHEPDRNGRSAADDDPPVKVGHDDSTVLTALYLHATGSPARRYDVLPMSGTAPDRTRLGNYDTDVDDRPGLRLRPTERGRAEHRLDRRQRWALARDPAGVVAGPLRLHLWIRPAEAAPHTLSLSAFVDVCTPDRDACQPVTEGHTTDTADPGDWQRFTVDLPPAGDVALDDGLLVLTVTAGRASTSDLLVAFDTTQYPASLTTVRVNLASGSTANKPRAPDRQPSVHTRR